MRHPRRRLRAALAATCAAALTLTPLAAAAPRAAIDFEAPTYSPGAIDGQDGWSSLGAAGSGCAVYDHAVVANGPLAPATFGDQSLRISNAVTSGCFADQTFSRSLAEAAGESTAEGGTSSSAPAHRHFEAEWKFASATPGAEQPGLSVVASPDRGDGARMSWIQMADGPDGLSVGFYDYQAAVGDFVFTPLAEGLDRTVPHTVRVTMNLREGRSNDQVKVFVDGRLRHIGTSWEDYFRDVEGNPTRTVDSILFRTAGPAAPATAGAGFLIDGLRLRSFG